MNDHLQHEPEGSPWIAKEDCCKCMVPVLFSHHNYWKGWGESYCQRCKRHYGWSVSFARTHNYKHRSRLGEGWTKVAKVRDNVMKRFNKEIED